MWLRWVAAAVAEPGGPEASGGCGDLQLLAELAPGGGLSAAEVSEVRAAAAACGTAGGAGPRTWSTGNPAHPTGGAWYWPNGNPAATTAGAWYWPNGNLARSAAGASYWPDGSLACAPGTGTCTTPDGRGTDVAGLIAVVCRGTPAACAGAAPGSPQLRLVRVLAIGLPTPP